MEIKDPAMSEGTRASSVGERRMSCLDALEAESIHILREVAAQCERPVLLYSVGKDSSVLLRLARKAFHPARIPFPLLHVDTSYKFPEMYTFRDATCRELGVELIVHRNEQALREKASPFALGTQRCCGLLKTQALLAAISGGGFDAAIGGARRDEERSRAKERVFSFRDVLGQWDPKAQRPELWNLFNARIQPGEHMRVFPLSNWTELDIWLYILREEIPIVPLYFAQMREVVDRNGQLLLPEMLHPDTRRTLTTEHVMSRFRTLGCGPCSGAIRSSAKTVAEIVEELALLRQSERAHRVIDHDTDASMEQKKREGYF